MTEKDLVYAAYDRCSCGVGLAYLPGSSDKCWDCSDILLGRAIPKGQPGSVMHTAQLPFVFYEIKSELQPSVNGATTRPKYSRKKDEKVATIDVAQGRATGRKESSSMTTDDLALISDELLEELSKFWPIMTGEWEKAMPKMIARLKKEIADNTDLNARLDEAEKLVDRMRIYVSGNQKLEDDADAFLARQKGEQEAQ